MFDVYNIQKCIVAKESEHIKFVDQSWFFYNMHMYIERCEHRHMFKLDKINLYFSLINMCIYVIM